MTTNNIPNKSKKGTDSTNNDSTKSMNMDSMVNAIDCFPGSYAYVSPKVSPRRKVRTSPKLAKSASDGNFSFEAPRAFRRNQLDEAMAIHGQFALVARPGIDQALAIAKPVASVVLNNGPTVFSKYSNQHLCQPLNTFLALNSTVRERNDMNKLLNAKGLTLSSFVNAQGMTKTLMASVEAAKKSYDAYLASCYDVAKIVGHFEGLSVTPRGVDLFPGEEPDLDPIVAQGRLPKIIEDYKILERCMEATPRAGLGKNRVKRLRNSKSHRTPQSSFRECDKERQRHREACRQLKIEAQGLMSGVLNDVRMPDISLKMDDELKEYLSNLIEVVSKFRSEGINHKHTVNTGFLSGLKTLAPSKMSSAKYLFILLISVLIHHNLRTNPVKWATCASAFMLAVSFLVEDERLRKYLSDILGAEDKIVPQGSVFNLPSTIISYIYCAFFSISKKAGDPVTDFFKKASDMPKIRAGVNDFMNHCIALIQSFLDFLTDYFGKKKFRLTDHPYPEVVSIYDRVMQFTDTFLDGRNYDYDAGIEARQLAQELRSIEADISERTPEGRDAKDILRKVNVALSRIQSRLQRSNISGDGCRIPPLGVLIAGPSKMGKTHLMNTLIDQVTALVIPKHMVDTFSVTNNSVTFTRANETSFWDGYHGQFNCYIDDLGQVKDVAGQGDNEYMECIRAIGPNDYPLNMATLEDKGAVNFTSRIMWATTNRMKFNLNSLEYNEPFCRRWTESYVMTCKPSFAVNPEEKDPWKRRIKHFPEELTDRSHLEFFRFNPETGDVSGPPIGFEDLYKNIVEAYERIEANGKAMLDAQIKCKAKALREREKRDAAKREAQEHVQNILYATKPYADDHIKAQSYKSIPVDEWEKAENASGPTFEEHAEEILISDMAGTSEPPLTTLYTFLCKKLGIPDWVSFRNRLRDWRRREEKKLNPYEWNPPLMLDNWLRGLKTAREKLADVTDGYLKAIKVSLVDLWEKNVKFFRESYEGKTRWQVAIDLCKKAIGVWLLFTGFSTVVSGLFDWRPSAESYGGSVKSMKLYRARGSDRKATRLSPINMQISAQSNIDDNCVDIAQKVIRGSQYFLHIEERPMGLITFVKGIVAIAPLHFAESLYEAQSKGVEFCEIAPLMTPNVKTKFRILDLVMAGVAQEDKSDLCGIAFTGMCQQKADILKYIYDGDQSSQQKRFDVLLPIVREKQVIVHSMRANRLDRVIDYSDGQYEIAQGYHYDLYTITGDCGALLFNCDSSIARGKIIGFHVAGSRSSGGYSLHLNRSTVQILYNEVMDGEPGPLVNEDIDDFPVVKQGRGFEDFVVEGVAPKAHAPIETAIVKSPLHNTYSPPTKKPAHLRPVRIDGVLVDPMERARIKYAPDTIIKPHLMERMARDIVSHNLYRGSDFGAPWAGPRVFTFEEACEGILGVEFADAIPRNTSCGYPWVLEKPPGAKGKQHIFGEADSFDYNSNYAVQVRNRVGIIIDSAAKGKRESHIYMDFLKDELRPFNKVDQGKTRMISACPVDFAIAFRMYFLDFMRWFMHNRIRNGSAVGVNPYSAEWTILVQTLRTKAEDMIAGDYSGYDASTTAQDLDSNLRIINDWYGGNEVDSRIRAVLWQDIMTSRHISGDVIYRWRGSMPSGSPPTTISNSMTNMKHIVMSYIYLYCEREDLSHGVESYARAISQFQSDVRYQVYGDDNLISVQGDSQRFYNQVTIPVGMKKIGCVYTNELKTNDVGSNLRSISEVGFLKRGFVFDKLRGRYVCPLELETILEMPQWTKKKDRDGTIVRDNVLNAIRELSLHPKKVYEKWAPAILAQSREHLDYVPEFTDQLVVRNLLLSDLNQQRFL